MKNHFPIFSCSSQKIKKKVFHYFAIKIVSHAWFHHLLDNSCVRHTEKSNRIFFFFSYWIGSRSMTFPLKRNFHSTTILCIYWLCNKLESNEYKTETSRLSPQLLAIINVMYTSNKWIKTFFFSKKTISILYLILFFFQM